MDANLELDRQRKERERLAREADIARDKAELAWTNSTELRKNS